MKERHVSISETTLEEWKYSQNDYSIVWKDVIFLPFNATWQCVVMSGVILNGFFVVYDLPYNGDHFYDEYGDLIYYASGTFYFIDCILSIAHRYMVNYRSARAIKPKSIQTLALDVLSLIPFYEVYVMIKTASRSSVTNNNIKYSFRIQSLIRIYPMFKCFHQLISGVNGIILTYLLKLALLIHIFGAVWYSQGLLHDDASISSMKFDRNNTLNWYIVSYCTSGQNFFQNLRGFLNGKNHAPKHVILGILIFGFIFHYFQFLSALIVVHLNSNKNQFVLNENLVGVKNYLAYSKISKLWRDKTMDYFKFLWKERSGIKQMPQMYHILPKQMQKEVTVDLYWDFMMHSHLFRDQNVAFKRALSVRFKNEFLLPGDFLYKVKDIKRKMVYIVSGIVQILAEEDEESPIASFSNGTILGEMSCFYPTVSVVNARCATYCDFYTLDVIGLYSVLKSYRQEKNEFYKTLRERVESARLVDFFLKNKPNSALIKKEDTCLKFIKRQWRELYKLRNVPLDAVNNLSVLCSPYHTSKYLDLLVFTKEIELNTKAVCLRGTCPFVLRAKSSFKKFLNYVVLFAVLLECLLVPYCISYHDTFNMALSPLNFFLDAIYVFHVYLELSTEVTKDNNPITTLAGIASEKIREITFMIDIVATIPLDYFGHLMGASLLECAQLRTNRMLRFYAILKLFKDVEKDIWTNLLVVKMLKYAFVNAMVWYWILCLIRFSIVEEYSMTVLLASVTHFTSFPLNVESVRTPLEFLYYFLLKLLGYYFFTMCIAEISSVYIMRLSPYKLYLSFVSSTKTFLQTAKVPVHLRNQIDDILHFWWYLNRYKQLLGKDGLLTDASTNIKTHIFADRIIACIKQVPLFEYFDTEMLKCVAKSCTIKTVPPGVEIVTCGKRISKINFILHGESEMPGDCQRKANTILTSGSAFPVIEFLHKVDCLTTITTITAVELLCLKMSKFMEIVHSQPKVEAVLNDAIQKHAHKNKHLLHLNMSRMPPMVPNQRASDKSNFFKFQIHDAEADQEDLEYDEPFKRLGKWYFIRHLFLRKTIDPESKKYICYECFRVTVIIMKLIFIINHYNLVVDYPVLLECWYHIVNVLSLIDVYVKIHCQYYNELGILVTHPLSTAKHYFTTTFILDIIIMMPLRYIKITHIFGLQSKETGYCYLSVITKPWHLYRLFGLLNYVQSKMNKTNVHWKMSKYAILVLVFIGCLSLILQTYTCDLKETSNGINISCDCTKWMKISTNEAPISIYLKCVYVAVLVFTTSNNGSIIVEARDDVKMLTVALVITFLLRLIIYAKIIAAQTNQNLRLDQHQERVNDFIESVKTEYVDDELIKETIAHCQHKWDKTHGIDFKPTFSRLSSVLHKDLFQSMFGNTIYSIKMMENVKEGCLRDILIEVEMEYYKKGTRIIRCNDIQEKVFVVHAGTVDICIAKSVICTLGIGGIFGCFSASGRTRQTIDATARTHVTVLVINSSTFLKTLNKYANAKRNMMAKILFNFEYEESATPIPKISETNADASQAKFLITEKTKWYGWWRYVVYMHVAPISTILLMVLTVVWPPAEKLTSTTKIIIYLLDILFYFKIIFEMRSCYEDLESGILITNSRLILKRYVRSRQIWIDVLTCFPFEVFVGFASSNGNSIKKFTYNRFFRCVHLFQYYNRSRNQLYFGRHLKQFHCFYWLCLTFQLIACVWFSVACPDQRCHRYKVGRAEPGFDSLFITYVYLINLFTTGGYMDVVPMNLASVIVTMAALIIFQIWTLYLIIQIISTLKIRKYWQDNCLYQNKRLHQYLKQKKLSPIIQETVWTYGCKLCIMRIPEIIEHLPRHAKEDLMNALYGHHLSNHFLFKTTHADLLRQLVVRLRRCIFFPQNVLVTKDDLDDRMYFIHRGTVEMYQTKNYERTLMRVLHATDTFGEEQLFYNMSHKHSYKAKTIVEVLTLKHEDLFELLKWFPASSDIIFDRIKEYVTPKSKKL
ncbi:hypothetical protein FQR65_LT14542 [Abscondita terminalis]|nr:hypothetical protein FQR65_LT14542 [Abscondita terminalis]